MNRFDDSRDLHRLLDELRSPSNVELSESHREDTLLPPHHREDEDVDEDERFRRIVSLYEELCRSLPSPPRSIDLVHALLWTRVDLHVLPLWVRVIERDELVPLASVFDRIRDGKGVGSPGRRSSSPSSPRRERSGSISSVSSPVESRKNEVERDERSQLDTEEEGSSPRIRSSPALDSSLTLSNNAFYSVEEFAPLFSSCSLSHMETLLASVGSFRRSMEQEAFVSTLGSASDSNGLSGAFAPRSLCCVGSFLYAIETESDAFFRYHVQTGNVDILACHPDDDRLFQSIEGDMYSEQEPETNLSTLQTSFVDSDSPLKGSVLDLSGDQEELPVSVRRVRQSSTLTPLEGPVGLAPLPAPPSDAHHSAFIILDQNGERMTLITLRSSVQTHEHPISEKFAPGITAPVLSCRILHPRTRIFSTKLAEHLHKTSTTSCPLGIVCIPRSKSKQNSSSQFLVDIYFSLDHAIFQTCVGFDESSHEYILWKDFGECGFIDDPVLAFLPRCFAGNPDESGQVDSPRPLEARFSHPRGLCYVPSLSSDSFLFGEGRSSHFSVGEILLPCPLSDPFRRLQRTNLKPCRGCLLIADFANHSIRGMDLDSGAVFVIAGGGGKGLRDGRGKTAQFSGPCAVAYDGWDSIYICETTNSSIRILDLRSCSVHLYCGTGASGHSDSLAPFAEFGSPVDLCLIDGISPAVCAVADRKNNAIRRVDPPQRFPARGRPLVSFSAVSGRHIFFSDAALHQIFQYDMATEGTRVIAGSGMRGYHDKCSLAVSEFDQPRGLAIDKDGILYVADSGNHVIRMLNAKHNLVQTIAGIPGESGCRDGPNRVATFDTPWNLQYVWDSHALLISCDDQVRILDLTSLIVRTLRIPHSIGCVTNG